MTDLFDKNLEEDLARNAPLADRMRPSNLDEYAGQEKIVGKGTLLRKAIEQDELPSMIFWGPPGCGKTTLAAVIAKITNSDFIQLSAVAAGKKDLLGIVKKAQDERKFKNKRTVLFIDEIHRWNKAQQDALLPYVEKGIIILIGATTENPSFEVIAALLSRARVYVLKPLSIQNLKQVIENALQNKDKGLGNLKLKINKDAEEFLINTANGDARIILNALEVVAKYVNKNKIINKKLIEEALQHKALLYDKKGDEHYNVISAFIKSLRGSDVDAAIYWLGRMLVAGEDPKFIARRMVIFASEDIGNAHSMALVVANAVFSAVEKIGMPECRINLAQGVVYLARAPKDNKSYMALCRAEEKIKETMNLAVPLHLRNAPTKLMKDLGYGKDYKYPHSEDPPANRLEPQGDWRAGDSKQGYLPEEIKNVKFF
ncbi:replication-associated recombination protein A [Patescibacteria group bacterium]|nr:replication-associated recombination protein A [Patescibacteria group bacterium]MBU4482181.1 replication-associated recombination protein A [Patescibacteria group bacterium]